MIKTWILVTDSTRARIFESDSATSPLREIETLAHPESRLHAQELTSDLPGRSFDSHGQGRHAVSQMTDVKQQEALIFVKQIADRLEEARYNGLLKQLIIAAPPAFLGLLRAQLSNNIAQLVVHEVNKNIAQLDSTEIRKHLPERLPILNAL